MRWNLFVLLLLFAGVSLRNRALQTCVLVIAFVGIGANRSAYELRSLADDSGISSRSYMLYLERIRVTEQRAGLLADVRQPLLDAFKRNGLADDEYAIASAMALGDKSSLTQELKDSYSKAGASHVLALSGMHLAIIYAMLMLCIVRLAVYLYAIPEWIYVNVRTNRFLCWLFRHRPSELYLKNFLSLFVLAAIWGYVVLVGMTPSVVRSAVMITVYGMAEILVRNSDTISKLAIALFVMLLASPLSVYDVGFQMSFLAVLGIGLYFSPLYHLIYRLIPPFDNRLRRVNRRYDELHEHWWFLGVKKIVTYVWSGLMLSVSAQIMVMPLVAHYFGRVSCYSLFTSVVVAFLATVIVCMAIVALCLSLIPAVEWVAHVAMEVLGRLIGLQNGFVRWEASLPGAYIDDIAMSTSQVYLIYIIIGCATVLFLMAVKKEQWQHNYISNYHIMDLAETRIIYDRSN